MNDATIGRYRIEKQLGKGAMGAVYLAHDPELDRRVAIKTVRLDSPVFENDREGVLARFQTEARSAARLSHPNIVTVYDYGEESGLCYFVMEYVEGQTLARLLAGGALPPAEAATIVMQVCDALSAAHGAGIVHRDIKPGNLMVDQATGLVKVMDFGIARLEVGRMTRIGMIAGTPRYMSPEQIQGLPVDRRSDLFSLGTVYAEALTGKTLFDGTDMTVISFQILNEEPEPVAEIEASLGDGPAWVVRRAMAKEPEKRFQSAAEFKDAIEKYCVGSEREPPGSAREAEPAPVADPADATTPAPQPVGEPPHEAEVPPPAEVAPDSFGQSDPVFTAPRRSRGPGKRFVVTSLVTVVAMGVAVGAWLKYGGGFPSDGAQLALPPGVDGPEAVAAADSQAAADSRPETPVPPPVRLTVTVEPGTATVFVDDTLILNSDGALLAPGPHMVHAESEGFLPLDTLVQLDADTTLTLALARAPPTTGTITVRASVPGQVLVDGRDRGAAPRSGLEFRPGSHTVRFVPDGAEALAEQRSITVTAGEAATVSFEITDGLLSVGVRQPRWATVYAGDTRLGDTPLIERRLPARVYEIRVEREGYVPQERLIRLEPGQLAQWVDIVLEAESQ